LHSSSQIRACSCKFYLFNIYQFHVILCINSKLSNTFPDIGDINDTDGLRRKSDGCIIFPHNDVAQLPFVVYEDYPLRIQPFHNNY
jgi:hypothetical protein